MLLGTACVRVCSDEGWGLHLRQWHNHRNMNIRWRYIWICGAIRNSFIALLSKYALWLWVFFSPSTDFIVRARVLPNNQHIALIHWNIFIMTCAPLQKGVWRDLLQNRVMSLFKCDFDLHRYCLGWRTFTVAIIKWSFSGGTCWVAWCLHNRLIKR